MSGFGCLSQDTIQCISQVLADGIFHVDPNPSTWVGLKLIQCEICSVLKCEKSTRLHCWLVDPNLPKDMFSIEKRKLQSGVDLHARVCECMIEVPGFLFVDVAPGDRIACQAQLSGLEHRSAVVSDPNGVWLIPQCIPSVSIKCVHLFCGAFHGWAQALKFLELTCGVIRSETSISIDWDGNVCALAADNNQAVLILPPWKELGAPITKDVVIACDVASSIWLGAVRTKMNVVWTISFPCPPYSKAKGKGPGLDAVDGKPILHVIGHARKTQPCMLLLENVDSFYDHPHARLIFSLFKWAGYRVTWMQKHDLAPLTDAHRCRWLAVLTRQDINDDLFEFVFKPEVACKDIVPWPSPRYQLALPDALAEMLVLGPALEEVYGNPHLLPSSKRGSQCTDQASVLHARRSDPNAPLATLVACYTKQHKLPEHTLRSKGLFAELDVQEGSARFHSPPMWAALLGNAFSLLLPSQLHAIYEQLGNSIAVPHAVMAWCAGLQALGFVEPHVNIEAFVIRCWEERLDASRSICVQTTKGFAIFTPGDFLLCCGVDRIHMLTSHGTYDGQCHIIWPDQVQSVVGYHVGQPLSCMMKDLGFPSHTLHLWGLMSQMSDKMFFAPSILLEQHEVGQFVFLPMMPNQDFDMSISDISSTVDWTQLPIGLSPAKTVPDVDNEDDNLTQAQVEIWMPMMPAQTVVCDASVTCAQALALSQIQVDTSTSKLFAGEVNVPWDSCIRPHHAGVLKVVHEQPTSYCVLEVSMLDGTTKFAPTSLEDTIEEALLKLNFHPKFAEMLRATHNGLLVPMNRKIGDLGFPHIRLVCFPLRGGGGPSKGKGEGKKGKAATVDPLMLNDPWKPHVNADSCRWDQLLLAKEHPVFDKATEQRLSQVPLLQLGPQKGGVAFATRAAIPSVASMSPPTTTVILIPGFRGLTGVDIPSNIKALPPQQVIVQEPQNGVSYKRLVIPLLVAGEVVFKVQETGAVSVSSTKYSEVVVEARSNLISQAIAQQFQDQPLEAFRRLVAASGLSMQEVSIYSYRKLSAADNAVMHQAIMKIPSAKLDEMLKYSGKHELFVRQFLQQDEVANHSLLPRYWAPTQDEVRKAYQLGHSLGDSFRGLALTPKGTCIRACNSALAAARALVLQGDVRFSGTNRHVVCKFTYTAVGFPFEVSHSCVIEATFKACGQPCIPLRSFRSGGLHTWVLGFADHPKQLVFPVKVDDQTYEVMLSVQQNIKQFKPQKNAFSKTKPTKINIHANNVPAAVVSQVNMTQQENQYLSLESRVAKLETQQSALSDKVDNGFLRMSGQLQQVLDAVSGGGPSGRPRSSEATGDTPPPKKIK